nr:ABC transporter substrate-binding protein [Neisseria subflava]
MPIGSGPYRFAKAENGRISEFVRDKNYWAQNLPVRKGRYNYDHIRIKYVKDEVVRIEGLKGGQYDFVQENVARNWRAPTPTKSSKTQPVQTRMAAKQHRRMQGFVINMRHKPLDNITSAAP